MQRHFYLYDTDSADIHVVTPVCSQGRVRGLNEGDHAILHNVELGPMELDKGGSRSWPVLRYGNPLSSVLYLCARDALDRQALEAEARFQTGTVGIELPT